MIPVVVTSLARKFGSVFISVTFFYFAKEARDYIFGLNEYAKKERPEPEIHPPIRIKAKSKQALGQRDTEEDPYPIEEYEPVKKHG